MTSEAQTIRDRLSRLEEIPSIPVVLAPLLRCLEQPLDDIEMQDVIELISYDKSLAAQCMQMANSPLFGRWAQVDSIRSAIVALGINRVREIALSCSVLQLMPSNEAGFDPTIFWEHSLGCALVARQLARQVKFESPDKAYLCGLLHDIGIIVNLWIIPREYHAAIELARRQGIPLCEAETQTLGLTHADSGRMLAEKWNFTPDLVEAISLHHQPSEEQGPHALLGLVCLSDMLCRMGGLGYGYTENRQVNLQEEPGFGLLMNQCEELQNFDWARLTFELESYVEEVRALVAHLYHPQ
jgi:putative nucleotidyltransferase with HDIG domain